MKNTKRKSFLFVLICSTFLLLMREGLALASGVPPAEGEQILAWARKETLLIALANECLGIGAMLLLFVAHPMHRLLAPYGTHRAGGLFSLLIATGSVMLALVVVQGRLVYPIVGITIDDPNLAVLLVAIFEGGLHLVFLMLSLCAALLAFSLRQNRYALIAGILSSVAFIVASYPDQAGYLVARVAGATGFLAFFFCAGAGLYRADVRQNV